MAPPLCDARSQAITRSSFRTSPLRCRECKHGVLSKPYGRGLQMIFELSLEGLHTTRIKCDFCRTPAPKRVPRREVWGQKVLLHLTFDKYIRRQVNVG
jgi:hypothetical protein